MVLDFSLRELSSAVDHVAGELLWEAEIARPAVSAFTLAERRGFHVAAGAPGGARGRIVRNRLAANGGAILLAPEARRERRHWAVAHEVGESAAHRVFSELGASPRDLTPTLREDVANRLAGALLLPRAWFLADGRDLDWDLAELKRRYDTASHELIARRTLELIDTPAVVTVLDQGLVTWRRGAGAEAGRGLSEDELRCWRRVHLSGTPHEVELADEPRVRVRAWPVHEGERKREVVLTTCGVCW